MPQQLSFQTIGDLLRFTRKQHGEKQHTFCKRMGLPQATLSAWETGRQLPAKSKLPLIAAATATDLTYVTELYNRRVYGAGALFVTNVHADNPVTIEDLEFICAVLRGLAQPLTIGLLMDLLSRRRTVSSKCDTTRGDV